MGNVWWIAIETGSGKRLIDSAISLDRLRFVGHDLNRPECVLATSSGDIYTADWRGGVAHLRPDGSQTIYAGLLPSGKTPRPNGIALRQDGSFLIAELGESQGGVYSLSREGVLHPFLLEVDGVELPPTNFVFEDSAKRVWVTISTREAPRELDYRPDSRSGFIVVVDAKGARIVADGLGYTNEAVVSPDDRWLYVNETFGRKLSRFPLRPDGSLGTKEVVTTFGKGSFPDGLTFDSEGQIWITSIISNRVIYIGSDGSQQILLEDADSAHIDHCERAYLSGTLRSADLSHMTGRVLKNISSLAFGGPELRTAYLGCLQGNSLATFETVIAGAPLPHWRY